MSNLEDLIKEIAQLLDDMKGELYHSATVKAAAARTRKRTLSMEALGKRFRKLSVAHHKK